MVKELPTFGVDLRLFFIFVLDDSAADNAKEEDSLTILFMFGGMDTQGEIFNDCLVLMPENVK